MSGDESDNFEDLYEEKDAQKHNKLVEKVLSLNKTQHLKKPVRSEPTLKVSEFDLVKSVTGEKGLLQIDELTKVLKSRKSRVKIGEKIKKVSKNAQTLPKPLEKPQADRIRRSVAYEKARLQLDKWEAVVTSNRVAIHSSFPLDNDFKIEKKEAGDFPSMWRLKSKLDEELEKHKPKVEEFHVDLDQKEQFPLTMKEMLARRREAAKLRAFQGYKEAKARRQNKIKSKKFHRIQKREKIKQKLKEFEQLQKTNPEEALKKLEEIEKARVEERFSLRHKSTGHWARSKQIRAKYDKDSRQDLAQQLKISKDLTQKLKSQGSDSEEEAEDVEIANVTNDESNPWINGVKLGEEVGDFVSSYRRYWSEKNNKESGDKVDEIETTVKAEQEVNVKADQSKAVKKKKRAQRKSVIEIDEQSKAVIKKKRGQRKSLIEIDESKATSEWDVSVVEEDASNKNLDELESIFNKVQKKMLKNVKNLQKKMKSNKKKGDKLKQSKAAYKPDLSLPLQSKKPVIDEELIEVSNTNPESSSNEKLDELKKILNIEPEKKKDSGDIDPNKYINVKTTNLATAIPDILTVDEDEIAVNQRKIISEAFEDDDLVHDFEKEKNEEIDKDRPKDVDLSLPGWGSWGGAGVKPSRRKRRRFIVKAPKKIPRRDDNKGNLIINEKAQSKIKEHMVNDVPFPFSTVKDFEASIRAPIGNTFVPETAFKKLTRPAVTTKMGAIIEPMSREFIVNR